jgi:hypothetical protein
MSAVLGLRDVEAKQALRQQPPSAEIKRMYRICLVLGKMLIAL